jgi:hypothetical protein
MSAERNEFDLDKVDLLRAQLRVVEQAAVVDKLLERLIVNCDCDELDEQYGMAIAELRQARRAAVAIREQGAQ